MLDSGVESENALHLTKCTEIQFLNTSTWVLGRYTWQEMQGTFRDPIGPSTSQANYGMGASWLKRYRASGQQDIREREMLDPSSSTEVDS